MTSIDTVVIGAGHAGMSVSRLLTRAGCPHVVLERGRVGERWRSERWDSLHLLTPNWMTRLPDRWYRGPDPEGFMRATDFVGLLDRYAGTLDVPVLTGTSVLELSASGDGYRVVTDQGTWRARRVVVATGPHGKPFVPPGLRTTKVLTTNHYRNPGQLAPGGVLVVGASASGVQIADELARFERVTEVTWVQDEPANQGAWPFMALNLPAALREAVPGRRWELLSVTRPASSAPSVGSAKVSEQQQKAMLDAAFA